MKTIIFFGAGKIGKRMLELWRQFGIQPDFIADNSSELWNTFYQGVKILPVAELRSMTDILALITCNQVEDVRSQLLDYGIDPENIYKGNTVKDMLLFWASYMNGKLQWDIPETDKKTAERKSSFKVVFDVQFGFVLGGVEAWALETDKRLVAHGKDVKFLTTDTRGWVQREADNSLIQIKGVNKLSESDRLLKGLIAIGKCRPCNVVCNFPCDNFMSACWAKMLWPQDINLIAVVHNDEEIYYKYYGAMKEVIDYCIVTCDAMENYFLGCGMAKAKIVRMAWEISCRGKLERTYSKEGEAIRIGYAGRIVVPQKRADLLAEVVRLLRERNINFRLEIAGTGDYEEELKQIFAEQSGQICFMGQIPRENISDFWKEQDIGINCSDWEGRCISRAEAMASGAVPVVTDTSSVRDEVQDSYNGYILSCGDAEGIADKICYLYFHREVLRLMGERACEAIMEQNQKDDLTGMWNAILKS